MSPRFRRRRTRRKHRADGASLRGVVLVFAAAGGLLSCTTTDSLTNAGNTTRRDSAGITIVENSVPKWTGADAWSVSEAPILELGARSATDSSHWFASVRGVRRLSDGTIVILDGGAYNLRFYTIDGQLLGTTGRRGSGPGEFDHRSPMDVRLVRCSSDTVFTSSLGSGISAFVSPGRFVRSAKLQPPGRVEACVADKLISFARHGAWPSEEGTRRDSVRVRFHSLDGDSVGVGFPLARQDNDYRRFSEGLGYSLLPFGRRLSIAARGPILISSVGDSYEVEVRDSSGMLTRIVRAVSTQRPVTAADIQKYSEFVLSDYQGNAEEARMINARLVPELLPKSLPSIADLRLDEAGNIWAREYNDVDAVWFYNERSLRGQLVERVRMEAATRWTVFDSSGVLLGDIQLPPRFEVHEIGRDWILGVWRDDVDVEYVHMYSILKRGG